MELRKESFSLGADPEIFLRDGHDLIPAFKFLPDKKNPIRFETLHNIGDELPNNCHANLFWDGFQAEFNCPAQTCIAWIPDGIRAGLLGLLTEARKTFPNAKLTTQNVFQIPAASLRMSADEHVMLGCDASANAYGMTGKHVENPRKLKYRFAGGHLHFGLNNEFNKISTAEAEKIVRYLDQVLGIWAVGAAASIDNPIRREYYGLAGEFRLPPHGLEYRTLSNFWFIHPGITNLVLMIARRILYSDVAVLDQWVAHPQETVETINACDVKRARKILSDNALLFKQIVYGLYLNGDAALSVAMNGVESVVRDIEDFETNWKLTDGGPKWIGHAGKDEGWYYLQMKMREAEVIQARV
jgi:hypothetical protein